MNLNGKKVLITGSAVRIGRAIALSFAKNGACVLVHCNESKDKAINLLRELDKFSTGNEYISADLSDSHDISQIIFPKLAEVDILINNASVFQKNKLSEETLSEAKKQFEINFWAPYTLMKEFRKQRASKESLIINILDYRIERPSLSDSSYLIAKGALQKLTELAALQWAPEIRVNAVAPGFVIPPKGMENSTMEKSLKKVPMGKPTPVSSIASACLFLSENDSITGETIFLDGGASL